VTVIQDLITTATSGTSVERERALLLLDLAKTIGAPMADRMIVAPEDHGLTTSVADHAAFQAIRAAIALEAAAKAVVDRFDVPSLAQREDLTGDGL
jgi:hypothetical protein